MKYSVKSFLIAFAISYAVIGLGVNLTLGPPGLTRDYLDAHKADHDRYTTIIKSDTYKIWTERPEVNAPQEGDGLQERFDFVATYEAGSEFIAEQNRRNRYGTLMDVFNALMVLVLVGVLGAGPIKNLLDSMVDAVRERIETAEQNRSDAARRKKDAQRKLEGFDKERDEAHTLVQERIDDDSERIQGTTQHALELLERETEDRKRYEELLAAHQVKEALVETSIALLREQYIAERNTGQESASIDGFLSQLGEKS